MPTLREIHEFPPEETQRMLEFVVDTARAAGLEDYKVVVNVGPGAGLIPAAHYLFWPAMQIWPCVVTG